MEIISNIEKKIAKKNEQLDFTADYLEACIIPFPFLVGDEKK